MRDIPQDIFAAAYRLCASHSPVGPAESGDLVDAVARAILAEREAERERCAKVAENFFGGDKREWNDTPMGNMFRAEDITVAAVANEIRSGK
jgi:hypothetical protein